MKPRCEVGDMAVVITGPDEFNCGLIVQVVAAAPVGADPQGYLYGWSGTTWWVRCSDLLTWWVEEVGESVQGREGPMPDSALQPIRGPRGVGVNRVEVADACA